jgi:hypothetical protein
VLCCAAKPKKAASQRSSKPGDINVCDLIMGDDGGGTSGGGGAGGDEWRL